MAYNPGKHIVTEFKAVNEELLKDMIAFKQLTNNLIEEFELQKVGEVYHQFDNGGYTAVVCLTESHLSIHTWPEFGVLTFDVFLSNFMSDNDEKVEAIYQNVLMFFKPETTHTNKLRR